MRGKSRHEDAPGRVPGASGCASWYRSSDAKRSVSFVSDAVTESIQETPGLPGRARAVDRQPGQQSAGSAGIRSGPLAGASKKVAMRMVGDPVGLSAEWT